MKFHFIGGLDCPEWVLSQISQISKINLNEFKELCSTIIEHFKNKTRQWNEIKFSFCDNSANDLEAEMLQLGLSTEHTKILVDEYNKTKIFKYLKNVHLKNLRLKYLHLKNLIQKKENSNSYLLLRGKG
ncbi:hypothetical protein Mgra_00001876 [Meloidogyne graminicola]|uniref:Uncharacterized protein n=1 Tax=Meloidogyne graminicola TaxID=189291 RepID=A0A8S9ZYF1_9BILA|nr:hypothetical protein Mgra_00001876 [Meloidogyne graminicola]